MRRVLSKGMRHLFAEEPKKRATKAAPDPPPPSAPEREVPIGSVVPNRAQPRSDFDDDTLAELADSIATHGILQPLVVRPERDGVYELIAGERRLRAARIARLRTVPIVVRHAEESASLELALVENLQREDISPIDAARAYRRLADEHRLSQEAIAARVGKARPTIANALRLLKLPDEVQDGLHHAAISEAHARALLGLPDAQSQLELYEEILVNGLSVREVERAVRLATAERTERTAPQPADPTWRALQDSIAQRLGSPVKLRRTAKGGRIVVDFYSDVDLQRILDALGVEL